MVYLNSRLPFASGVYLGDASFHRVYILSRSTRVTFRLQTTERKQLSHNHHRQFPLARNTFIDKTLLNWQQMRPNAVSQNHLQICSAQVDLRIPVVWKDAICRPREPAAIYAQLHAGLGQDHGSKGIATKEAGFCI